MARFPFPSLPSGWYALALADRVRAGSVHRARYFDRELVLYRTAAGAVRVVGAFCPHLGAHLGHGGRVEGDELVCPFHGFRFDPSGACSGTPHGSMPAKRVCLESWRTRERNGLILVWFDALGRPPEWEVPELDLDGWSGLRSHTFRIATHPQETTENSVDFGHFTELHSFTAATMQGPVRTEGPLLRTTYSVRSPLTPLSRPAVHVDFDVSVWGLGYSLVEVSIPRFGVRLRELVLPTPITDEELDLRVGSMIWRLPGAPLTAPLKRPLLALTFRVLRREVERDIPIWQHKRYCERPGLAPGDGPIGTYRRWAKQFYVAADEQQTPVTADARGS